MRRRYGDGAPGVGITPASGAAWRARVFSYLSLERQIAGEENVDNGPERERKALRKMQAVAAGGNWVATFVQRFTVRPLKFIRWLRNFVYREAPWRDAVARLAQIYATF